MDDPTCIGCGEKYNTQKQLSAHAARCSKNKSLTLDDVFSKLERKSREQETSSVIQRGLVYPTWSTNRLKSLIFIKKTHFT
ncbi:hypothetical protein M405DRAFT_205625 [Rhizopogon salebrosus TDB-379]|nr:hypothetical protein M405DRAFT_205625 [Rhizopogon salebrosus TDB-379]